jgi:hypothetical protein
LIELIQQSGSIGRWGHFASKEACQAEIEKYEAEQHGYNGRCREVIKGNIK